MYASSARSNAFRISVEKMISVFFLPLILGAARRSASIRRSTMFHSSHPLTVVVLALEVFRMHPV